MQKVKKSIIFLFFLFICCAFFGCTLPNQNITIEGRVFNLSVAKTTAQRAIGLSNISQLADDKGMLFLLDRKEIQSFWMKNTLVPLQIIFVDGCKIVDIQEMQVENDPSKPTKTYTSKILADKAIELNSNSVSENLVGQEIPQLCGSSL